MEKEKLKGRIIQLFRLNNLGLDKIFLIFIFLADMLIPQLSVAALLCLVFFLAKNVVSNKILVPLLYITVPVYAHIYFLDIMKSTDFILWFFLLLFSIKITIYVFNNIFDDVTDTKKYAFFGLLGSLLVAVLIGILSSLFLKQSFFKFIALNIAIALAVYFQYLLKDKFLQYFNTENISNLINLHNNFVFTFLVLLLYFWFI